MWIFPQGIVKDNQKGVCQFGLESIRTVSGATGRTDKPAGPAVGFWHEAATGKSGVGLPANTVPGSAAGLAACTALPGVPAPTPGPAHSHARVHPTAVAGKPAKPTTVFAAGRQSSAAVLAAAAVGACVSYRTLSGTKPSLPVWLPAIRPADGSAKAGKTCTAGQSL